MDAGYINILLQLHLLLITLRLNNLSLIKEDFVKLLLNSFFFFVFVSLTSVQIKAFPEMSETCLEDFPKVEKKKKRSEKKKVAFLL